PGGKPTCGGVEVGGGGNHSAFVRPAKTVEPPPLNPSARLPTLRPPGRRLGSKGRKVPSDAARRPGIQRELESGTRSSVASGSWTPSAAATASEAGSASRPGAGRSQVTRERRRERSRWAE